MKGKVLLKLMSLSAIGFLPALQTSAQNPVKENIAYNLGGTRFVVAAPTSISGIKKISYATWGAAASPTISNAVVAKAYDTLGAATLTSSLTGKFALIYRGGGITFSDKAARCKAAGAIGVIVVNNVPGDPVGMGATPSSFTIDIPVLMVSDVDGKAMNDVILAAPGSVKITLGTWNTGGAHDLGVRTEFQAMPHALNIPLHQMVGSAGTKAYKHYIGGAIANYGTNTETGITVTDSVYWMPIAGGSTFQTANSYSVPSISVADSIRFGFGTGSYELTPPTTKGKYEHRYSIAYGNADAFPQDNMGVVTQNITDSVYSKGEYDHVKGRLMASWGIRPGVTTPVSYMMGNNYFIKNGGYALRKVQFMLLDNSVPTLAGYNPVVTVMKWTDGVANTGFTIAPKDSFMQASELQLVGVGGAVLTTLDSSGETITVGIQDPDGKGKTILLDANCWYYVAVSVPAGLYIGCDQNATAFSRSFAQFKNGGGVARTSIEETPGGIALDPSNAADPFREISSFFGKDTNVIAPFPFSGSIFTIDSVFYDRFNEVPAIALLMSANTVSIKETNSNAVIGTANIYPNPASSKVTIDLNLTETNKRVGYSLMDITGRRLFNEIHENIKSEKFEINVQQYPAGTYFVLITGDKGITTQKVVIEK